MNIHCIGIGGIGLSALAALLQHQGNNVSGCDRSASPVTERLQSLGIRVSENHGSEHISPDVQMIIYSDAIPDDHPERERARELSIPQKSYFEALGEIANKSKCLIAIAGSHGKTSTTAMLIDVLEAAGRDPTAVVGSLRTKTKSNFRAGSDDFFVVEADEYLRHFLQFTPKILVITNIDADHLDYYKDLADIQSAFRTLAEKVSGPPQGPSFKSGLKDGPWGGYIVCDPSDPNVAPILAQVSATIVDYRTFFDPHLPMNVLPLQRINAAAALAVAHLLKIDGTVAKKALGDFAGTWRRFEYKGKTKQGAAVYDDYAHHPKEVALTLASVREMFPRKNIIVAFQPHLYSRTKLLLNDFATAFKEADEVFLAPIFAAREEPDPAISSEILAQQINEHGTLAYVYGSLERLESALEAKCTELGTDGLVVTMGAGELYKVAKRLMK